MSARSRERTEEGTTAVPPVIANANTWAIYAHVGGSLGQLNARKDIRCLPRQLGCARPEWQIRGHRLADHSLTAAVAALCPDAQQLSVRPVPSPWGTSQ
jgi:hypothetical protein